MSVKLRDTKKGQVLDCEIKHPDKEENINVSSVAYLRDKQVVNSGLWYSLDSEKNIQKGTALATFLQKVGANTPADLVGKEVETELDEAKWLCFKAY